MKKVNRALKLACAIATGWCLSGLACPTARAQVLDQVPSDALVVVKINHLQDTNTKIASLLQNLGITDLVPTTKDPLSALETQLGIGPGIDPKRDAAGVILNGTFEKNASPPFVMLIPVSDYKAFLGSVKVVSTDGDVSTIHFNQNEDDAFVESWGDYAAISDKKENVSVKHEGLKPTGLSRKQLDEKDICAYVNFPVLKTLLLPKLKEGSDQAMEQISKQVTDPAKLKVAQTALQQAIQIATEFLNDAQGTTLGVSLSDDGISSNMIVEVTPDSYLGKAIAQAKTTDQPLMGGLPKENYLFYGGSVQNSQAMAQLLSDVLDPVVAQITAMGDDGKKAADLIGMYKDMITSVDSGAYGVVAPTAALGQGSLLRMLVVYKGDAQKIHDAALKAINAQTDVMKAFNFPQADLMKTTITPNFKTVNGVKFDRYQSEVNPDNTSQEAMRASEMLSQLYGPDGASGLMGVVDPKTFITSLGIDDDLLGQTVDAAKAGTDVLSDDVKSVDDNLPKTRAAVAYFGLGQFATTALSYAKAAGFPVGIQLPNNLPPIGFSVGTDTGAMRGDVFVPTKLLQSMVQAGATLYQQFNNRGGGGGGGL